MSEKMREILFRGKREDNGQWIQGDYQHFHIENDIYVYIGRWGEEMRSVKPETIGQFTGLTDKNGKKIFEGDIVKALRICNQEVWTGYVVMWKGCFALKDAKTRNVPAIDLFNVYEVIGNIHDNPELLEEGTNV
jgi:uncharacterized phage protein (TIGR01671 family)